MTISRFSFPTDIQFGPGASKLVGDHLRERGFKRPIVVTDKGLAALPVLKNFVASLGAGLNVICSPACTATRPRRRRCRAATRFARTRPIA